MEEAWKEVPGFDGKYLISDLGRMKRYSKAANGKIFKSQKHNLGYRMVRLYKRGVGYTRFYLHRLVCKVFLGDSDLVVDHINGNKRDNRLSNLQYVTQRQNTQNYQKSKQRPLPTGVHRSNKKYITIVTVKGEHIYLGVSLTQDEAGKRYDDYLTAHGLN